MRRLVPCVVIALSVAWPVAAQSFRGQVEPTVKAVRDKLPAQVMGDQVGDMLNEIAWTHRPNLKLLKKGGGGVCLAPQGVMISCDIIIWAPPGSTPEQTLHIDVFGGASGDGGLVTASPYWKSAGPCTKRPANHPQGGSNCEMKNALDPIAPADVTPDPKPDPPPPPPPADDVLKRLAALDASVSAQLVDLKKQLVDVLAKLAELQAQADKLATQKLPCFTAQSKVLGAINLCPQEK